MNVDGLHARAGTRRLIEIHGSLEAVDCSRCSREYPFSQAEKSIRCPHCGGLLDTRVVLYGDGIPMLQEVLQWVRGPGTWSWHQFLYFPSSTLWTTPGDWNRGHSYHEDAEHRFPRSFNNGCRKEETDMKNPTSCPPTR